MSCLSPLAVIGDSWENSYHTITGTDKTTSDRDHNVDFPLNFPRCGTMLRRFCDCSYCSCNLIFILLELLRLFARHVKLIWA